MSELIAKLRDQLNVRTAIGLAVIVAIFAYMAFDYALRKTSDLSLSVATLDRQIDQLETLDSSDIEDSLRHQLESDLETYRNRLMNEETTGLNLAKLQSTTLDALNKCGLSNIRSNVSFEAHADFPEYTTYLVDIRANDRDNRFPLCLQNLQQAEFSILVSALTSTRNGSLLLTLKAYGATLES